MLLFLFGIGFRRLKRFDSLMMKRYKTLLADFSVLWAMFGLVHVQFNNVA